MLDTNVLSETRKKQAHERVMAFLSQTHASSLYISVLTLGELRKGVALKSRVDPHAAKRLASWVDGLEFSFADRLVGIDKQTANLWGKLSSQRPRLVVDTLLVATAVAHNLIFVTRNASDVADIQVKVLNPWLESKR